MTPISVGRVFYWSGIGMCVAPPKGSGKLSAVSMLAHQRRYSFMRLRASAARSLVMVRMGLNAVGCYGLFPMAKAHIGHQG